MFATEVSSLIKEEDHLLMGEWRLRGIYFSLSLPFISRLVVVEGDAFAIERRYQSLILVLTHLLYLLHLDSILGVFSFMLFF